mmetsp:Transcript_34481/g.89879  ORF Transcript_34481/g.89879 Transcript_34481/m.89879 type:complete len:688 (+) Transcript_34481:1-2064(+)
MSDPPRPKYAGKGKYVPGKGKGRGRHSASDDGDDEIAAKPSRAQELVTSMGAFAARLQIRARAIVDSTAFSCIVYVVIILNAIQMGIEADRRPHPDSTEALYFFIAEIVASSVFFIEMVIKLVAYGTHYFESAINCLDMMIVLASGVDGVMWLADVEDIDLAVVQAFRLLRLVRVVRVVRTLQWLSSLTVILHAAGEVVTPVLALMVLLLVFFYGCSLVLVPLLGRDEDLGSWTDSEESLGDLFFNRYEMFGTTLNTMFTMMLLFTLSDISSIIRPMMLTRPLTVLSILVFILFVAYGVANVIVGVVVQNVFTRSEENHMLHAKTSVLERVQSLRQLHNLMMLLDVDGDGMLGAYEMAKGMQNKEVRQILTKMKIPTHFSASDIVNLLDDSGNGTLAESELLIGFYRLMEHDEFETACTMQHSMNTVKAMVTRCEALLEALCTVRGVELSTIDEHLEAHVKGKKRTGAFELLCEAARKDYLSGIQDDKLLFGHDVPAPEKGVLHDQYAKSAPVVVVEPDQVQKSVATVENDMQKMQAAFEHNLQESTKFVTQAVQGRVNSLLETHGQDIEAQLGEALKKIREESDESIVSTRDLCITAVHKNMEHFLESVAEVGKKPEDVVDLVDTFKERGYTLSHAMEYEEELEAAHLKFDSQPVKPEVYEEINQIPKPQRATGLAALKNFPMCQR